MTVPTDPFLFVNGAVADAAQVNARYAPLYAALAGALDTDNLLDTINELLGLSKGAIKRRGKAIIPTTETRTNTAFGTLPTPDQVTGIVLPTDSLIAVWYKATWAESVFQAARAAIFIGANELQRPTQNSNTPPVQEADAPAGIATNFGVLTSYPLGLVSGANAGSYTGDVATGQSLGLAATTVDTDASWGGPCYIFAAPGTYTISVQFKASSGSVTAKNRKLWVSTMGF